VKASLSCGRFTLRASDAHETGKVRLSDWWALVVIVLCYGFYNLDKSLVSVLIEPIKAEFHLSDSEMGLMTGLAASVPFALACIPVGMLADRVNRRNLLAILVGGWSAVTGLTSIATSTAMLFASRVGIGAFEAGFTPASLSSLNDRFPLRLRSTVMGIFSLGAAIGVAMGMGMGGWIEEFHGWRTAFLVAGVPGLVLAVLLVLTTQEPRRLNNSRMVGVAEKTDASFRAALVNVWRDRALLHIAFGMTWGASMLAVFAVWTPSVLRRSFDFGAAEAGLYAGMIAGLAGALGAAAGGIIADAIGKDSLARKLWVPVIGVTLSVVTGLVALLAGNQVWLIIVLMASSTFFGQFYIGTCYAIAATLAGPARQGVTLSIMLVMFNLISYSLGSGLVGKISDLLTSHFGDQALRYAYASGYAFSVIAVVHFFLAQGYLRRREQQ
jgi:MFS family permease